MSDTNVQEQSVVDPEGTAETGEAASEEIKPAKVGKQPHDCYCQTYEVYGDTDDEVFTTGCNQTTLSTFAQGHDARLVSFLVSSHFDGPYKIRQAGSDGKYINFDTPELAVQSVSQPLANKARAATENYQAKLDLKAQRTKEREDAKAAKAKEKADKAAAAAAAKEAKKNEPKATGAEVVAGSHEGERSALQPGEAMIKVGRFEYRATVDGDGVATYVDGKGQAQTVERDGYKLLEAATA